jgi:hypothetical protein
VPVRCAGCTILIDANFLHRGDHVHLGHGMTAIRMLAVFWAPAVDVAAGAKRSCFECSIPARFGGRGLIACEPVTDHVTPVPLDGLRSVDPGSPATRDLDRRPTPWILAGALLFGDLAVRAGDIPSPAPVDDKNNRVYRSEKGERLSRATIKPRYVIFRCQR